MRYSILYCRRGEAEDEIIKLVKFDVVRMSLIWSGGGGLQGEVSFYISIERDRSTVKFSDDFSPCIAFASDSNVKLKRAFFHALCNAFLQLIH
jgi:hypothetical protein